LLPRLTLFPYTTLFRSQQIDRAILEVRHRLIESGLDKAGKAAIKRIVVALELAQYLRAVVAVMWVALPRINRVAARASTQFLHRDRKSTRLNSSHVAIS